MPGSKFNKRPVARRRPAICIAPAGSCLPVYDGRLPDWVSGMVNWTDLDPVDPHSAAGIVRLGPRSATGKYSGHIHLPPVILGAEIQDNYPTPSATVSLRYWDPFWLQLTFYFPTCPMPLDEPFDTHLLTQITIPLYDFRKCRFAE